MIGSLFQLELYVDRESSEDKYAPYMVSFICSGWLACVLCMIFNITHYKSIYQYASHRLKIVLIK